MKKRVAFILLVLITMSVFSDAYTVFSEGESAGGRIVTVGWSIRENVSEYENGEYSGYNYDFLKELSGYTGWEYDFKIGSNEELYEQLASGGVDMLCTALYDDTLAGKFGYSALPYGDKYTVLFVSESSGVASYEYNKFDGMKIGVVASDTETIARLEHFAAESDFGYTAVIFGTEYELTEAVAHGEADAGAVDAYMCEPGFRVVAEFSPVPYYFVFNKNNGELISECNRALYRLNLEHPYIERELYDKHFGIPFDVGLSDEEIGIINASRENPIDIGIIPSCEPSCYYNAEKGEYEGILMGILKTISEKTGLCFNYVTVDLSLGAPVSQLKSGFDGIIAGIVKTERFEKDESLILSDVIFNDTLVIVGRKQCDFTGSPEDKTIGYIDGFQVSKEYIDEKFPEHKKQAFGDVNTCLKALSDGKIDAAVYMRACTNFLLHNPHYENLEILPAYFRDIGICAVGSADAGSAVIGIMNKGLSLISENEFNDIIIDTTVMNPYRMSTEEVIYKYRLPLIIIFLLVSAVIITLVLMIAGRKHTEEKLKIAYGREQLAREKEKNAHVAAEQASIAKGNFMSRMSHEIRTPLNAVIGYNTIARDEMSSAKTDAERRQADMKVMDCLTKSDIASRHLLTIINDVLDMSSIESGRLKVSHEKFDFRALVSSLTAIFYSQAKTKGVELEVVFGTLTEEWFVGDAMRVNQILANLLSNAVKFTPSGGRVLFKISQPDVKDNTVRIRFEVSDTGIGMDSDCLKRIWTPFEQADSTIARRFGGTGLGLSITKSLVDLMEGSISVTSEPGKGTSFVTELAFERTEQPEKAEEYDFSKINALVADDDSSTCDYIKLLFSRCGARCTAVTSGREAVEEYKNAEEKGDPYTLCMFDLHMPDMDGIETVENVRGIADSNVPIIVLTAYDFSEVSLKASKAGINMFLSKPLFQSSLFDMLVNIGGVKEVKKQDRAYGYSFRDSRVLLVEDNAMNMEIARRILQGVGLDVDCAWNGAEAVEMFASSEPGTYKAVLMDIQMPIMDGYKATRIIRSGKHPQAKDIPIIAMTADAFAENVAQALENGMNDHIAKPNDIKKLFETLKKFGV